VITSQGLFYFEGMEWLIKDIYDRVYQGRKVLIDSRKIEGDEVFVALQGDHQDGNTYALRALELGAAFAIIDDADLKGQNDRLIYVDDALLALQELSKYHRSQLSIPVIGVTGSNGKTTTKELLVTVLSQQFQVAATSGNYNNHIGVPLTLLDTPSSAEILILEMGTNQPGDIQQLCLIGDPTHGVITNIGDAHLEQLVDRNGVLQEKGDLFRHVIDKGQGTFFLYTDDEHLSHLPSDSALVVTYGLDSSCHITSVNSEIGKSEISMSIKGQKITTHTALSGQHNMQNILTAAVIGNHFGVSGDKLSKGIASYVPSNMRSQIKVTKRNRLLIDAYNANPSSMSASIEAASASPENLVLILGDMLELGASSSKYHKAIIEQVEGLNMKELIVVGPIFTEVVGDTYRSYKSVEDLLISGDLSRVNGALVLIKGSRGVRLEKVLDQL